MRVPLLEPPAKRAEDCSKVNIRLRHQAVHRASLGLQVQYIWRSEEAEGVCPYKNVGIAASHQRARLKLLDSFLIGLSRRWHHVDSKGRSRRRKADGVEIAQDAFRAFALVHEVSQSSIARMIWNVIQPEPNSATSDLNTRLLRDSDKGVPCSARCFSKAFHKQAWSVSGTQSKRTV